MSNKKSGKIPRLFRGKLGLKKFNTIIRMLTDKSERELFESSFPAGVNGKHQYVKPEDEKKAARLKGLLKNINKVRSGPRMIRLIVVFIILIAPVVFNFLFLDKLASRVLESKLEEFSDTDVTVKGLDIQPFRGRINLVKLAFASDSNPMIDSLVLANMTADLNWPSVFFRRLIFNELSAGLALDVSREFEAEYPGKGEKTVRENSAEDLTAGRITLPDFANISSDLIPDETLNYLNALRLSVENENQDWTAQINSETDEIRILGDKISIFLAKPLPVKSDIQAWTSLIEEGKGLSSEVVEKQDVVNRFQSNLNSAAHNAGIALEKGRAAVQSDMNKVKSNLDINDKMINQWLETIITSFAGPQTAEYYRKISKLILRFIDIKDKLSLSEKKNDGSRRMSHGRIVTFPVHLPPRFSIRTVRINGEGISIDGSNIGIDHDLAGAPSIIMIQLNGFHGMEGLLSLDLTIDGRKTAEDSAFGSFNTSKWLWSAGDEIPGGLIAADSVFSINPGEIISQGQIVLSDWIAVTESSGSADILSFISSSSPPLAFLFNLEVDKDETDMSISIDKESLPPWKKMFADSILSVGKDQAVKALPPAAVDDLMAIEAVLGDWENKEDLLDNLSDELQSYDSELNEMIDEWTGGASGVLGGVGSLFGN